MTYRPPEEVQGVRIRVSVRQAAKLHAVKCSRTLRAVVEDAIAYYLASEALTEKARKGAR